jgi:HAD superfamily hydrolase (TIGR01509 family)
MTRLILSPDTQKIFTVGAAFVDMDGTLFNSTEANAKAYSQAFEFFGLKIEPNLLQNMGGLSFSDFFKKNYPEYSAETLKQVAYLKSELYPNYFGEVSVNFPLLEYLTYLKSEEIQVLLVTNASHISAVGLINVKDLSRFFDSIITSDGQIKPKPSPDLYLKALKISNCKPEHALVFEDSEVGFRSATSAGIKNILFDYRFH